MPNKREIGAKNEQKAGEFLQRQGYEILAYNVYCRHGELDIVAKHGGYLVFVEVKYRGELLFGYPLEAVDAKKQKTICICALDYICQHGLGHLPVRFDVVSIVNEHVDVIQNAFDFMVYEEIG